MEKKQAHEKTIGNDVWASEILGVSKSTVRNWRSQRRGPAYRKIGRRVVYTLDDLNAYMQKRRIDPEAI